MELCKDQNCRCRMKPWGKPSPYPKCSLQDPMMMVIPPEGIHIPCPVHGQHFLPGSGLVYC